MRAAVHEIVESSIQDAGAQTDTVAPTFTPDTEGQIEAWFPGTSHTAPVWAAEIANQPGPCGRVTLLP